MTARLGVVSGICVLLFGLTDTIIHPTATISGEAFLARTVVGGIAMLTIAYSWHRISREPRDSVDSRNDQPN